MEQETEVKQLITKEMTIGDVVAKYPAVIEPLQEAGVHCVGCHVSYSESLEDGFKGHGMADEEVDAVIEKLNKAAAEYKVEAGKEVPVGAMIDALNLTTADKNTVSLTIKEENATA